MWSKTLQNQLVRLGVGNLLRQQVTSYTKVTIYMISQILKSHKKFCFNILVFAYILYIADYR